VMLTRNTSGLAGVVIIYQCIPLELYGPNIRSAERLSRLSRAHLPGEDCPEVDDLAPAPVTICADRSNLGPRRRTFGSCAIRVDAPVGSAPPIGTGGSHSDTTPAKSGLYWFSVLDFLLTTAGKDGVIQTRALDVP
jgi:hypothetical protein